MDIQIGSYTQISNERELRVVIKDYSDAGFKPWGGVEYSLHFFKDVLTVDDILQLGYMVDDEGDGVVAVIVNPDEDLQSFASRRSGVTAKEIPLTNFVS